MIHNKAEISNNTGPRSGSGCSLGTNAKSSTPQKACQVSTVQRRRLDALLKGEDSRALRHVMLSQARDLLYSEGKRDGLQYPRNYHQTAKCMHTRHSDRVSVHKPETGNNFYKGIVSCGRVFSCPVCAAKVQEVRRQEISKTFDWAYSQCHKVIMVTLTFPHGDHQSLRDLILMQRDALKRFRAGNPYRKIRESVGYVSFIRSLECTWGKQNGWHPHTHEAWIVHKDADVEKLRQKLINRWYTVCLKSGLLTQDYEKKDSFYDYSIQITDNCSNSDYLAKLDDSKQWGMDKELAVSSVKQGNGKGKHPFELLAMSIDGDALSGQKYVEFVDGMRGATQIYFAAGLKDMVGIRDLSDEEIVDEETQKENVLLGMLTIHEWRKVAKYDLQARVLHMSETGTFETIQSMLAAINVVTGLDDTREEETEQRHSNKQGARRMRQEGQKRIVDQLIDNAVRYAEERQFKLEQEELKRSITEETRQFARSLGLIP